MSHQMASLPVFDLLQGVSKAGVPPGSAGTIMHALHGAKKTPIYGNPIYKKQPMLLINSPLIIYFPEEV